MTHARSFEMDTDDSLLHFASDNITTTIKANPLTDFSIKCHQMAIPKLLIDAM